MVHETPAEYDRPEDGTVIGTDSGSGQWTGEKRRKHLGRSLPREVVRTSSSSSNSPPAQAQEGDQEEDPFFTTDDLENITIDFREVMAISTFMHDKPSVFVNRNRVLGDEPQRQVYQRLMLYRLRAHKLSKGEPIDKLDDETLKKELPDFLGKETEHDSFERHFDMRKYFQSLEKDEGGSVDWYFDPEFSKLKHLADYQRLVLRNHDDVEYLHWEDYRSNFTTYKMDKDYVRFFSEMSGKLQWLKKYIQTKDSREWLTKTEIRGAHQALKIAKRFPGMTVELAYTAYREHIWSLHYDYLYCEEWDTIFLEIWKLVTRKELEFTHALVIVKELNLAPQHGSSMLRFLLNRRFFDLESKFDYCVKGIPHDTEEGIAKELIRKAVWKIPKKKMLHQYIKRKMSIAEMIGLHEDRSEPRMMPWDGPKSSQVYA